MRWGRPKFALFAVIVLAAGVFTVAPPADAAAAVDTAVGLFWRTNPDQQPTGPTVFFVAAISESGTAAPTGNISVAFDKQNPVIKPLKAKPSNDELADAACGDNTHCSISDDISFDLGFSPHYFKTEYPGVTDSFNPSTDELGFARGILNASSETSEDGEFVTYTFQLLIHEEATPDNRRPKSPVDFADTQGHTTGNDPRPLDSNLRATWTVAQSAGQVTTTATYAGGGEDVFLPFAASRSHSVTGKPEPPGPNPGTTATTRRATTTTRRSLGRTPTTAALAPINPGGTSTTIAGETTSTFEAFGDFTGIPTTTGQVSAASNDNDEGPPIAVVATTLLALGVLGGVAAFRRYRRGGIDWF